MTAGTYVFPLRERACRLPRTAEGGGRDEPEIVDPVYQITDSRPRHTRYGGGWVEPLLRRKVNLGARWSIGELELVMMLWDPLALAGIILTPAQW